MVFRIALIMILLALTGCEEQQIVTYENDSVEVVIIEPGWIESAELAVNSLTSQVYGSDPNCLRQVVNRQGQAIILLIQKYKEVEEQVESQRTQIEQMGRDLDEAEIEIVYDNNPYPNPLDLSRDAGDALQKYYDSIPRSVRADCPNGYDIIVVSEYCDDHNDLSKAIDLSRDDDPNPINPVEGQLRWVPVHGVEDGYGNKPGYLETYNGSEWIEIDD